MTTRLVYETSTTPTVYRLLAKSENGLSAFEVAKKLKISKREALVSINILIGKGVVQSARHRFCKEAGANVMTFEKNPKK